jgi:hypothetical protein
MSINNTFGIEIEMASIPDGYSALINALRAKGVSASYESYNHSTRAHWKLTTDASCGWELVSPVLTIGEDAFEEVRKVCEALNECRVVVNRKCGLHVHIGAAHFNIRALKNFAKNYLKFEDFFDAIMPESRRRDNNRFIASHRSRFGAYDSEAAIATGFNRITEATDLRALQIVMQPNREAYYAVSEPSRYYKLNLTAFGRYQTVEFRQHSGTTDYRKIRNWVLLLNEFTLKSAVGAPRPRKATSRVSTGEAMSRFFTMFGIAKEQRDFYRARFAELHRNPQAQG